MTFPRYPEYKGSGVGWLGEVPAHWEVKPLKHVATYNDDVLPESTPDNFEIKYVEISDVDEHRGVVGWSVHTFASAPSRARRVLRPGDVLISTVRTYLRAIAPVIQPPANLIGSTGFAVIRPVSTEFRSGLLGYALRAECFISEVISRSVGVSYPAINASDLVSIQVPVPPLAEQLEITSFLGHQTAKIDKLIEEQRRLIELLKEKRQAVISHAVTKGLDPNVPMKDSGVEWLGEVPVHWQVGPLKRVWDVKDCKHVTAEFVEHGYPLASIREVQARCVDLRGAKQTTEEYYRQLVGEGRKPEAGDLIVSRNATVGEISEVADWHPLFSMGQDVCLLKRRFNGSAPGFLYYLFKSEAIGEQINSLLVGATFKRINVEEIRALNISFPPEGEQWRISRFLDREDDRFGRLIGEAERAIELLRERRSALISAGVTGKIDVRGWSAGAEAEAPELAMVAEESSGYSAQGGAA